MHDDWRNLLKSIAGLNWRPTLAAAVACLLLYGGWLQVDVRLSNVDHVAPVPLPGPPEPGPVPPSPGPGPAPVPVPPRPPAPPVPPPQPELTGLAKLACDEAERLKLDKTPEAAEVFASVARSVQAAIAAGTPPTREEMSATTKERLAPLGLSAAWQEWEKTLAAGYLRGEVRTVEQQVKAWEQIAEGLKRCQ